jgi:hypothetical protein
MYYHKRYYQILLVVSTIGFSWLAMMAVHEFGHVLNAWLSGGVVTHVLLKPWTFSQTDVSPNPHPMFVAWGGVLWGCIFPVAFWLLMRYAWKRYAYLAAWFAGFCLIANGTYIAAGSFLGGSTDDGGVILHLGGSPWLLVAYGLPAALAGLWLWHDLGIHFGIGRTKGEVDRRAALAMTVLWMFILATEILFAV